MATTDFKIAAKKASTQAHYLLEIDLINNESDAAGYGNKTIYLSDKYLDIESVRYEGLVSSWGGMDVSLSENEGIAAVNDFSITVVNKKLMFQDYVTDSKFSDLFAHFYFAGCTCRVYQWFEDLTLKSDALLIFSGITKQPSFDRNYVSFDIEDDRSILIDVPVNIVTLNDFANAPQESIGFPLPIVYGDDWDWNALPADQQSLTPCVEVDSIVKKFYIANHQIRSNDIGNNSLNCKIYLKDAGIYGALVADQGVLTNDENGAYFTLGYNIYYLFRHIPKIRGSQCSAAITDYSNILDYNDATTLTLQENEALYLKFDSFPELGNLEFSNSVNIAMFYKITAVSGGSPYGVRKYYNEGYDAAGGGFSTGANITGTGTISYDIGADTSVKGQEADQSDKTLAWTLKDLSNYEYGLTVNAGCTITLAWIYLIVYNIPLTYKKYWGKPTRIERP